MTTPTADRDLLELAAKAAGIRYDKEASKPHPKSGAFWGLWLVFDGEPPEHARRHWTPLTDDGDALRLAVKLRISIMLAETHPGQPECVYSDALLGGPVWRYASALHGCPYAATRRAIVRAAAAIGEAMP